MNTTNTIRTWWIGLLLLATSVCRAQIAGLPYPTDTIQDTVVYRYPSEKSIGLYRISKNFGVTQAEILRWNPQLRERGPQLGEVLLIPAGIVQRQMPTPSVVETPTPDTSAVISSAVDTSAVWRIAVMLPLNAQATQRNEDDDRFYDFYTGLLTAVWEAQQKGMRLEIHTYDVPRVGKQLNHILETDAWLPTAHVIVGPAYAQQVNRVAQWAQAHQIRMFVPFTSKVKGIETNPYLFQFNPITTKEVGCVADTIEAHQTELHCVYVAADGTPSSHLLADELNRRHIWLDTVSVHALMTDSAGYAMQDTTTNLLILHTDNYANAGILIPHIKQLAIRYPLRLYVQYTWLKNNEIQPLDKIYSYVFDALDEQDARMQQYTALHDRYFASQGSYQPAADHPRYDLLGYDLTAYLLQHVLGMPLDTADMPTYRGLQSAIHFERIGENGGWMNTYIQTAY